MSDDQQKSPEAFRTISEVAAELDLPQHVLRFWETKFTQIKPMKRGGGRRYYRPEDVDLLRGIRLLLYGEGFTIRGVQRVLKDKGAGFVADAGASGAVETLARESHEEPRVRTKAPPRRRAARVEPRIEDEPAVDAPTAKDFSEREREPASESAADVLAGGGNSVVTEAGASRPMSQDALREFLPARARAPLEAEDALDKVVQPDFAPPVREAPRPRDIPVPPVARGLGVERRRRLEAALDDLIEARQLLEQAR